jgi:hypothetical protein
LRDDLKDEVIHVHGDIADLRRDIGSFQQEIGDLKEFRVSDTRQLTLTFRHHLIFGQDLVLVQLFILFVSLVRMNNDLY